MVFFYFSVSISLSFTLSISLSLSLLADKKSHELLFVRSSFFKDFLFTKGIFLSLSFFLNPCFRIVQKRTMTIALILMSLALGVFANQSDDDNVKGALLIQSLEEDGNFIHFTHHVSKLTHIISFYFYLLIRLCQIMYISHHSTFIIFFSVANRYTLGRLLGRDNVST